MLKTLVRDDRTWAHRVPESLYKAEIIAFICRSTFVQEFNGETNNNNNSSRDILSKQWTFYQRFTELAHF